MTKFPKNSKVVSANDPSAEFPYTWIDADAGDYGMFHKTQKEAEDAAKENYHNFSIEMKGKKVLIVEVKNIFEA